MTLSSKQRAPSKMPGIFEDALVMDVGDQRASSGAGPGPRLDHDHTSTHDTGAWPTKN